MDLQQIRNFLKLSDELHFWRTAGMMNITQSALSRQIQSLEEELGLQLFERDKRNVKLTAAGLFLKEKWTVLLDDLNYIHLFAHKISEGETGRIRIAHPDSISYSLLPDLISRIADRYPELTVELEQLLYQNTQEALLNYKIDIAFTRQVNTIQNISSQQIMSEPVALFVAKAHPYQTYSDLNAESLVKQQFILPVAEKKSSYHYLVQEMFSSYNIKPNALYRSDFGSSILGLVARGLGVAILPAGFAQHGTPDIRAIELPFQTILYINWRADDKSPVLQNVLRIINEGCK